MRVLSAALSVLIGAGAALAQPSVTSDVVYGDLERQKLDFYWPAKPANDTPVLLFIYGGGWERGAKADIRATALSLNEAGIAVAVPDYRLYPDASFPQFVEDCAQAVGHVWRMLNAMDSRHRLFIGGHSAGAFNAAMLAADEHYLADAGVPADAVAGYVLLSGPFNMGTYVDPAFGPVFPVATRDRANVNTFIDGKEPPLLLMTAEADDVVPAFLTRQLGDTVKAKGGQATVATYKGGDHLTTFFGLSDPDSAVRKDLEAFIAAVAASSK